MDGQMSDLMGGLLVVLVAGSLLALLVGYLILLRRRVASLRAITEGMGFTFIGRDSELLKQLGHFHLFSQGYSRKINNLMRGQIDGADVLIFDYFYNPVNRKGGANQTVVLFESGRLQLTPFSLRPEHLGHRIGRALGHQDINFEASPTFSAQYLLQGQDEGAVRALFGPEILWHYEGKPGLSTEGAGQQLLYYRASKRVWPKDLREYLNEALQAYHLFSR